MPRNRLMVNGVDEFAWIVFVRIQSVMLLTSRGFCFWPAGSSPAGHPGEFNVSGRSSAISTNNQSCILLTSLAETGGKPLLISTGD